jgi:choline-sulfatase
VARRVGVAAPAALWLALVLASCGSGEKRAAVRPVNLVVVTVDTLRADRLGCYGYAKGETPNIDRLAGSGVVFENAVTHAPLTAPSHASMFTGMYPTVHKVRDTGGFVLPEPSNTLAEALQQQGWETAAFVGASVLKKGFGFGQGFGVYDDRMPKQANQAASEFPERRAGEVVDRAIEWLDKQGNKRFFLWVHVFDPHSPYDPPAPFQERYAGRAYDGEIAYTDRELGRLFDRVSKFGGAENTLIAVLSDHGESLSDHGEFTHGVFLYDSTVRIAFVLSGGGVPKMRVKQQVRAIDLTPTVLGLLGAKPPQGMQGASLAAVFEGKESPADVSYSETLFTKLNMGWSELRAVRTNRWKYIQAPKPELYDLVKDPGESVNVIDGHAAEVQEMEGKLAAVLGGKTGEKVETVTVDRRTMDQLKSLGYLGGGPQGAQELTGKGIDPKDRVDVLKLLFAVSPDAGAAPRDRTGILREALKKDPGNPTIYYHLGQQYAAAGQDAAALQLYRDGIRNGVRTAWLYSRMGSLLVRQGKREEAIAAFEKASQLNPSDAESLSDLGMAYLESGKVADAERAFKWAVAASEDFALAHNGLGLAAIEKRDLARARTHFARAVELDPNLLEAQLNLGRIYKIAGENQKARECFEAFLARANPVEYRELIPRIRAEVEGMR